MKNRLYYKMWGRKYKWVFTNNIFIVIVSKKAINSIIRKGKKAMPNETGGTLIGYYSANMKIAYIINAIGIKHGERHSPISFYRPPDIVDKQLEKIELKSKGALHYIGEWHTHPNVSPIPSSIDIHSLVEIAQNPEVATNSPILIVLGESLKRSSSSSCSIVNYDGKVYTGKYRN